MSASLKTTNYELGIYAPNDVTSWLTDFNGNMNKIDAQMKANSDGVQGNSGDISSLGGRVTTVENNVEQLELEYESMLNKFVLETIDATNSANVVSSRVYIAYLLKLIYSGTLFCNINKKGNQLSTINITGGISSFIPLINIAGNPFNYPAISSPSTEDLNMCGNVSTQMWLINNSTDKLTRNGALFAYYNGTNTLIGFTYETNSIDDNLNIDSCVATILTPTIA